MTTPRLTIEGQLIRWCQAHAVQSARGYETCIGLGIPYADCDIIDAVVFPVATLEAAGYTPIDDETDEP